MRWAKRRCFVRPVALTVNASILATALCLAAKSAVAAPPCGRPDLLQSFPADGATDVPMNARLSAHYAATAEYANEAVLFEHVGVDSESPRATFDSSEGLLAFQPPAPLVAGDSYVIRWPALRGLSTAVMGKGAEVKFTSGTKMDVDSPTFGGVRGIVWDVERVDDDCTDALEDRFVFDISLDDAADDGGRGMLSLLVFQSKGGSASASPAPVLTQGFSDTGAPVRVERSIDSAVGKVCFAALARDATGRVSSSADREVCVATVKPPFFYGCTLSREDPNGREAPSSASIALALLALVGVVRRALPRRRA